MNDFVKQLDYAELQEYRIACWLREGGYTVLHVFQEHKPGRYRGPRVLTPRRSIIAPDLLVVAGPGELAGLCWAPPFWVEAKGKSGWTWTQKLGRWEWGMEKKFYDDYLALDCNPYPILVMTACEGKPTKGDERPNQSGLFLRALAQLAAGRPRIWMPEPGTETCYGREGMVYWPQTEFFKIASYEALLAAEELFQEVEDGLAHARVS